MLRKPTLLMTPCLLLLFLGGVGIAQDLDLSLDEVEDVKEAVADDALKMQADEAVEGDHKTFAVVTDEDTSTLAVGDIYKSNQSFFKVQRIGSQGKEGGSFVVERIRGKMDPDLKWNRVSGEGPVTLQSRETLLDRFATGGFLMYPLALLLLTLMIVTIRNIIYFRDGVHSPASFIDDCRKAIKGGDLSRFEDLALKQKGLLATACRAITVNFSDSTMDDIKERVQQAAAHEVARMRFPLRILNFITVCAPLLGLLGTVVGMIACFDSLAGETASQSKSMAMAAGIKQALLTTAFGLTIAVPSLFVFFVFSHRLNAIIAFCERQTGDFIQMVSVLRRKAAKPTKTKRTREPRPEPAATQSA